MKKKVVESIISMREVNRYTRGLYSYVGYNIKWIPIPTPERVSGTSKFPLKKLISYLGSAEEGEQFLKALFNEPFGLVHSILPLKYRCITELIHLM